MPTSEERFINPIAIRQDVEQLFARLDSLRESERPRAIQQWRDGVERRLAELPFNEAVAIRDMFDAEVRLAADLRRAEIEALRFEAAQSAGKPAKRSLNSWGVVGPWLVAAIVLVAILGALSHR